jgi:hypothetical protein
MPASVEPPCLNPLNTHLLIAALSNTSAGGNAVLFTLTIDVADAQMVPRH